MAGEGVILSAQEIQRRIFDTATPLTDRLVITPVLDWSRQASPGRSAIDLRLGQRFTVPRRTKLDSLDHLHDDHMARVQLYKDDHHVLVGDHFVLHPRQFILGETLEWIHLPRSLAAYVVGRSSWGRDGLIIATATGVHANYRGILTLEITNLGEIPIRLYPGLTIAQLFIHTTDDPATDLTGTAPSTFSGSTGPGSGDAAGAEREMIRHFARQRGLPVP